MIEEELVPVAEEAPKPGETFGDDSGEESDGEEEEEKEVEGEEEEEEEECLSSEDEL